MHTKEEEEEEEQEKTVLQFRSFLRAGRPVARVQKLKTPTTILYTCTLRHIVNTSNEPRPE